MRKEVLFAIIAGISIGLLVAFGAWKITLSIKRMKAPVIAVKKTEPRKKQNNISVTNLIDYDVITDEAFVIKGITKPLSDVVITTSDDDYYIKSDKDGEFEKEITIPAGISEVKLIDLDSKSEYKIVLIFSTEALDSTTAFVGTITDISSGTIQLKTLKGDIKQISSNEETRFVNSLKKNIEVKQTDLAIGDYIIAMGKINGNSATASSKVLITKRIIITSPLVENKLQVQKIKIEKISKTMINDIKLPTKWNGPNIKDLEVGEDIITVGTTEDEKYTLRSIFSTVE